MQAKRWIERHPWSAAIASFVVLTAPQWVASVWALFSNEPLIPWLIKHRIPYFGFSAWWITAPLGVAMFAAVWWITSRKSSREEIDRDLPVEEQLLQRKEQLLAAERSDRSMQRILKQVDDFNAREREANAASRVREKQRRDIFLCVVDYHKQNYYDGLKVLQVCKADELESNDELVKLCDELVKYDHPHPLAEISGHVPQEKWLEFLKEARLRGMDLGDKAALTQYFIKKHPVYQQLGANTTETIALLILTAVNAEYEREPSLSKCRPFGEVIEPTMQKYHLTSTDIDRGLRYLVDCRCLKALNRADGRAVQPSTAGLQYLSSQKKTS